jgi:hypothetical protein
MGWDGSNWMFLKFNDLLGGFNHLEKYDFVNGKDDIPCNYYGK